MNQAVDCFTPMARCGSSGPTSWEKAGSRLAQAESSSGQTIPGRECTVPDTIDDDWIEDIERLKEMMDKYMHLRQDARDAFEIRYERQVNPDKDCWELCSRVLARRDIVEKLSVPW